MFVKKCYTDWNLIMIHKLLTAGCQLLILVQKKILQTHNRACSIFFKIIPNRILIRSRQT